MTGHQIKFSQETTSILPRYTRTPCYNFLLWHFWLTREPRPRKLSLVECLKRGETFWPRDTSEKWSQGGDPSLKSRSQGLHPSAWPPEEGAAPLWKGTQQTSFMVPTPGWSSVRQMQHLLCQKHPWWHIFILGAFRNDAGVPVVKKLVEWVRQAGAQIENRMARLRTPRVLCTTLGETKEFQRS